MTLIRATLSLQAGADVAIGLLYMDSRVSPYAMCTAAKCSPEKPSSNCAFLAHKLYMKWHHSRICKVNDLTKRTTLYVTERDQIGLQQL